MLAGILLIIAGTINVVYGFGALDDANYFVNDTRYILDNLNTLGWVLLIIGAIQLTGGFSLLAGNTYGRVIGIIGGSLGAITALLSIGQDNPWWSLAIFFICIYIVHGIIIYGEDERVA
ncbi:MAG: DUF7144 family membrane protein [Solirubrobacterales bacterium]